MRDIDVKINDTIRRVPVFQLLQWKYAIQLEIKGMKVARRSVCAHVKRLFKIAKQEPRENVLGAITDVLDQYAGLVEEQEAAAGKPHPDRAVSTTSPTAYIDNPPANPDVVRRALGEAQE